MIKNLITIITIVFFTNNSLSTKNFYDLNYTKEDLKTISKNSASVPFSIINDPFV